MQQQDLPLQQQPEMMQEMRQSELAAPSESVAEDQRAENQGAELPCEGVAKQPLEQEKREEAVAFEAAASRVTMHQAQEERC